MEAAAAMATAATTMRAAVDSSILNVHRLAIARQLKVEG
jgi:hypothetical protein